MRVRIANGFKPSKLQIATLATLAVAILLLQLSSGWAGPPIPGVDIL